MRCLLALTLSFGTSIFLNVSAQEGVDPSVIDENSYCNANAHHEGKTFRLSKPSDYAKIAAILHISDIGAGILKPYSGAPPLAKISLQQAEQQWGNAAHNTGFERFALQTSIGDHITYFVDTKFTSSGLTLYRVSGPSMPEYDLWRKPTY
jgi:hypothetical protein